MISGQQYHALTIGRLLLSLDIEWHYYCVTQVSALPHRGQQATHVGLILSVVNNIISTVDIEWRYYCVTTIICVGSPPLPHSDPPSTTCGSDIISGQQYHALTIGRLLLTLNGTIIVSSALPHRGQHATHAGPLALILLTIQHYLLLTLSGTVVLQL